MWLEFCTERSVTSVTPTISGVLEFLTMIHDKGLSYSSVNTAKSALSAVLDLSSDIPLGHLPIIRRFMKGIFERRPSFPKHSHIWDIKVVLDYFRNQTLPSELSLTDLSQKLAFLLCLLSGQRCQTIQLLSIDSVQISDEEYIFHVTQKVKQTRVGFHIEPLQFIRYPLDQKICIVSHLDEYVERTRSIRKSNQLLVSFLRPHDPVSTDTIARWVKNILSSAGIDIAKFQAHSVRAAATSFTAKNHVSVSDILSAVGWTNERTFQRFYNKPYQDTFTFGNALLTASVVEKYYLCYPYFVILILSWCKMCAYLSFFLSMLLVILFGPV